MPLMTHIAQAATSAGLRPAGQRPGADSGNPQLSTRPVESGTSAQIGVWECEPGGWAVVDRPNTETCLVLSGAATITDDATGEAVQVVAGDFLVLRPGWTGRWDVTETLRKAYTIF